MNVYATRSRLIVETMEKVKALTKNGADIEALEHVKAILNELALQRDLFPNSEFPWPTDAEGNNCWCLYKDADGKFALYIDLINKGQGTVPHDHGDSWAVVTAVEGLEKHYLFKRVDGDVGPGEARLDRAGEITISPGQSVSLLVGGIHAIEAVDANRSMMLHCYGQGFDLQTNRLEYDQDSNTCGYSIDAAGTIYDYPLHDSVI